MQLVEAEPGPPQLLVRVPVPCDGVEVIPARESVEEPRLLRGREQPLGLVLPVHLHEVGGERHERGYRHDLAPDPGRAPAVGRNLPGEDDLAVLRPLGCGRAGGRPEPGLDARATRALPDERR